MINNIIDEIWRFGQKFYVYDKDTLNKCEFMGFIEPMDVSDSAEKYRSKCGIVPLEKFRLICQPKECFPDCINSLIIYGGTVYELLSVKDIYFANKVSHKECVIVKTGEVKNDA